MQKDALNNVHISAEQILITPEELKNKFPLSVENQTSIEQSRQTIADIIHGRDPRLLIVCTSRVIYCCNWSLWVCQSRPKR